MNYYSFEIDGEKVGYFEYEDRDGKIMASIAPEAKQ